jgi:hypothetical protein
MKFSQFDLARRAIIRAGVVQQSKNGSAGTRTQIDRQMCCCHATQIESVRSREPINNITPEHGSHTVGLKLLFDIRPIILLMRVAAEQRKRLSFYDSQFGNNHDQFRKILRARMQI